MLRLEDYGIRPTSDVIHVSLHGRYHRCRTKTQSRHRFSSGFTQIFGTDMQLHHVWGGVWVQKLVVIEIAFRLHGGAFHDAYRGTCRRCHTNFSHDSFFIGRIFRFIGNDMRRLPMRGNVWYQEKFHTRQFIRHKMGHHADNCGLSAVQHLAGVTHINFGLFLRSTWVDALPLHITFTPSTPFKMDNPVCTMLYTSRLCDVQVPTDEQQFVVHPWRADCTKPFFVVARVPNLDASGTVICPQRPRLGEKTR